MYECTVRACAVRYSYSRVRWLLSSTCISVFLVFRSIFRIFVLFTGTDAFSIIQYHISQYSHIILCSRGIFSIIDQRIFNVA